MVRVFARRVESAMVFHGRDLAFMSCTVSRFESSRRGFHGRVSFTENATRANQTSQIFLEKNAFLNEISLGN